MSVTKVRSSTCPHVWCATTEPHDDEDGHYRELTTDELGALADVSRIVVGLYDDTPGVNVSVELVVQESSGTAQYLRDLASELTRAAGRIDAMVGAAT